ncbi:restriction endonuclease [Thiolapillus sp.]|uniref:restriction endonuclease n=1 Tax=Thiolapillus sp. TaxID=2017437 RepID=UPI003AF6EEA7
MAKRKSTFEDLVELVALMPWWTGVVLAVISYVLIHSFATQPVTTAAGANNLSQVAVAGLSHGIAVLGQYFVPAVFLVGALVSAVGRSKRKRLLATAKESTGPHAIKSLSWQEFEMLVGEAFRRRGYAVRETASGADGGVDLELRKDGELELVQCKQWRATKVGVSIVRELFGIMAARGASAAYVVTSGVFSREARNFAAGRNITLIDGEALDSMIRDDNAKLSSGDDSDIAPVCPNCGGVMVKRTARKGVNAGQEFWGCANFPKCRGTRGIR